jgi:hypothetical protein
VKSSAIGRGLLNAQDIDGAFHDAHERTVPAGVRADFARLFFGQSAASRAFRDSLARRHEQPGEFLDGRGVRLDDMERDPFGGPRPNARQTAEDGHQARYWFGKGGHERFSLSMNLDGPLTGRAR